MSEAQVRVMLVDDHEVVREGLRTLLGRNKGLVVVAEASTMAEAIESAGRARPDVIVMDVRLPDGSGVEACRTIRETRPETKVIMLTSYADDEALFASIVAGAAGYLLKQTRGQAVIDAITAVAQGRSLLDPEVTGKVLERVRRGRADERRGQDESRDRRGAVPFREDREELREPDPRQARPQPPRRGRGVHGEAEATLLVRAKGPAEW